MVFYHGGGWVIGDIDTHASFCAETARVLDMPVISVDYRLAPENPWPAAPDDCEAAARWVGGQPGRAWPQGDEPGRRGDSAGGNLAIVAAMALRDARCGAGDRPVPDLSRDGHVAGLSLLRAVRRRLPAHPGNDGMVQDRLSRRGSHIRTSPLIGDLAGMPPAVVLTASLDPIRDQGRAYAGALAEAGVPVVFREAKGNIHGFVTVRQAIPSSQGDVAGALAALKTVIAEAEGEARDGAGGGRNELTANTLPYRPCAGVMLLNREGKVFVGQRIDTKLEAWQMPQGGIDDGEDAEATAIRELGEEIGVTPDKVETDRAAPGEFLRPPARADRPGLEGQMARPAPALVPVPLPGERHRHEHPHRPSRIQHLALDRSGDLPRIIVPFKQELYRAGAGGVRQSDCRKEVRQAIVCLFMVTVAAYRAWPCTGSPSFPRCC